MTENDNVSAGLLGLISNHKITTLIIIGIGKSWCVFLRATEAFFYFLWLFISEEPASSATG
jgi:hypothetical protein